MPRCGGYWYGWLLLVGLTLPADVLAQTAPDSFAASRSEADMPPWGKEADEVAPETPHQQARLLKNISRIHFPVTTHNRWTQAYMEQGIGQLHTFSYREADCSFREALLNDPACAMTHWGLALAHLSDEKQARSHLAHALERRDSASARERLYIDALVDYLRAGPENDRDRRRAYVRDLERIAIAYPQDLEARVLLALQLWRNERAGLPLASRLAVDALLKEVLAKNPHHPCHHYRIQLWCREQPELALDSALPCALAAPRSGLMWHMAARLFASLGRYHEALWYQEASARADHATMHRDGLLPDQVPHYARNNAWRVRTLLQLGRTREAIALAKRLIELPRHPKYNSLQQKGSYLHGRRELLAALSRCELWDELLTLKNSMYLEPVAELHDQVRRLRCLGRAHLCLGIEQQKAEHLLAGQAPLIALKALRTQQLARRTAAVRQAESRARVRVRSQKKSVLVVMPSGQVQKQERLIPLAETVTDQNMDAGTARAIQQARQQVETDFTAVLHSLNAAVEELAGLQALAKGEGQQGLLLLQQAGDVEPALLAWACQRAGRPDQAEKILTDQVQQRPHEVLPLAQLVYFRNQQGRLQDARHGFDRLRSLAGQADLQTPALTRLTPLARTLGYPADWRLPQTPAAEARERPTLDSLGPAHWQPMKAPAWKLVDARGRSRSLAEFQGKPVVLMFYLGFGCLHCMEQLQAFAPRTDEFARAGIELVGISIEAEDTLKAGVQNYDPPFPFPLLANSNLEVFKAYHVYDDFQRKAMHGTFVIDGQGRIRWHDIRHEPFMDVQFVLDEARRLLQQTPAPAEETLMESSPRE